MTKIIQLEAPDDNESLGLSKGEDYFVVTDVNGVRGITEFVNQLMPALATKDNNGLLDKEDKIKLDALAIEPYEEIKLKSPDGSIFVLSVSDDGSPNFKKEDEI